MDNTSKKVFISSTYNDLKNERTKIREAILSIGWFPKGMELFPATNEEVFEHITKEIDECDYYFLFIGGRYGSMDKKEDISYTEKEYNYAISKGLPIIAFVNENYKDLPSYEDQTKKKRQKLDSFIERVKNNGRTVKFWTDSNDLPVLVLQSIFYLIKKDNLERDLEFTVGGVSFKMIHVKGGTFMMGDEFDYGDAEPKAKPIHKVKLSSYWIGQTQVTQELWEIVMGNNPSTYKIPNGPVLCINWKDCQVFINKLNILLTKKLDTLGSIRFCLPSEAEWEFAARGGNDGQGYIFSGGNNINDVGWIGCFRPHPVAKKMPNELGIYDMSGNVFEWCQDTSGAYNDEYRIQKDPIIEKKDVDMRICRGGSWKAKDKWCRVSYRHTFPEQLKNKEELCKLGLRLVLRMGEDDIVD